MALIHIQQCGKIIETSSHTVDSDSTGTDWIRDKSPPENGYLLATLYPDDNKRAIFLQVPQGINIYGMNAEEARTALLSAPFYRCRPVLVDDTSCLHWKQPPTPCTSR